MIKAIYGTYRPKFFANSFAINSDISMNGYYTPSYFLNNQFKDYLDSGLTKVMDNIIDESRYVAEVSPGIKKMTRFFIAEYDETYVNGDDFRANLLSVGSEFNIKIFDTNVDAISWIRESTDLKETSNGGVFIIKEHDIGVNGEILYNVSIDLN